MPSSVRLLLGGVVGVVVTWFLATGAAAQPGMPGYPLTMTAQAGGGGTLTATPTATGAATATGTSVPSAGAVAPNSATIAGGRGRVANVRDRGFTVLWTTDADAVGQVNHGTSAALGSTATDQRGPAFAGRTHYVEIGGLTPNTTYFFDLVSGGVVDNNAGQHYQIRTGPEIAGSPPLGNRLVGDVRQPGGVAPAGGALVWATVKDANNQGTLGSSQLLGALAHPDGRFEIGLQPRTADLGAYFTYQTEGDLIEASARHDSGSLDNMGLNTAITQGGTTPNNAQLVLTATSAAATTPTATTTPPAGVATPLPTNTPLPAAATPGPAVVAAPAPGISPTPNLVVPVQLPSLKEMALDQPYPPAGQSAPIVVTAAPAPAVAYPGAASPPQSIAPAKPAQVGGSAPPPAQPPGPQPVPPGAIQPTPLPGSGQVGGAPATVGPGGVVPGAQPGATGFGTAPGAQPGVGAPVGSVPGGAAPSGAPVTGTQSGAVPGTVGAKPGGSFGQAPAREIVVPQTQSGPPATVAPSPAPLSALANLPPIVSALFYGGILVVALGGGLAIWSVLNGTGWRPR